jgi:hypothetical protein
MQWSSSDDGQRAVAQEPGPQHIQPVDALRSKDNPYLFDIFLTHNWGADGNNHQRVSRIHRSLRRQSVSCWFDEERMSGDIVDQVGHCAICA